MSTSSVSANREQTSPRPPRPIRANARPVLRRLLGTRASLPSQPDTALPRQGSFGASAVAVGTGVGGFLGASPSAPAGRTATVALEPLAQTSGQAGGAMGVVRNVLEENGARTGARLLGRLATPFELAGATSLPGQVVSAGRSIAQAVAAPTDRNLDAAGRDTSQAVGGGVNLFRTANDLAPVVAQAQVRQQAARAFRQAVPNAHREVVRAAARSAAQAAMSGARAGSPTAGMAATRAAVESAARAGGRTLRTSTATTTTMAARQLLRTGGNVAARAATQAVARGVAMQAVRVGARFLPGVNLAMAAADTYTATRAMANPNASVSTRALRLLQAGGSLAAASSFPPFLLVGGAIATVASIAGDISESQDQAARGRRA